MLTFLVRCTHVGRYATEGLGWGMLTFLVRCTHVGVTSTMHPALSHGVGPSDQSLVLSSCKNCRVCSRSVDAAEGRN